MKRSLFTFFFVYIDNNSIMPFVSEIYSILSKLD